MESSESRSERGIRTPETGEYLLLVAALAALRLKVCSGSAFCVLSVLCGAPVRLMPNIPTCASISCHVGQAGQASRSAGEPRGVLD